MWVLSGRFQFCWIPYRAIWLDRRLYIWIWIVARYCF